MASTCGTCGGTGKTIPRGSECSTCGGDGAVRERQTITVDIPGGIEDGMRLRVDGHGDAPLLGRASDPNAKGAPGDLYVFVRVAADPKFKRAGSDILYTATIPLTTALLGGEVTVPTLDGDVNVRVATGTGTGDKMTLAGKGMKRLEGRRAGSGDLRVEFRVAMPKYLTAKQRTIAEMLADETGDKTARRIMNVNWSQYAPLPLFPFHIKLPPLTAPTETRTPPPKTTRTRAFSSRYGTTSQTTLLTKRSPSPTPARHQTRRTRRMAKRRKLPGLAPGSQDAMRSLRDVVQCICIPLPRIQTSWHLPVDQKRCRSR